MRGFWDDRQNSATALEQRIRSEFAEMPGLTLTAAQAARLFGIPEDRCAALLRHLTTRGVLQLKDGGRFGLPRDQR